MTFCPACRSPDTKRFGTRPSGKLALTGGRLVKEKREKRRYRCNACGVAFLDPPTAAELEVREAVALAAMRHGIAGAAESLAASETAVVRILERWAASQAPAPGSIPDVLGLKALPTPGHVRLLVCDGNSLEMLDVIDGYGDLASWAGRRGGAPALVVIDFDSAICARIASAFPLATLAIAPSAARIGIEKAALRELTGIVRALRAAGRNAALNARLFRRRSSAMSAADRQAMEWWPARIFRLWKAKEALLDAVAAPPGRERDMLLEAARADLRSGDQPGLLASMASAWLDVILAGADRPWIDEIHLGLEEIVRTARRFRPGAAYPVLRAIILFREVARPMSLAPSVPFLPGGPVGRAAADARRSIADAVGALSAF